MDEVRNYLPANIRDTAFQSIDLSKPEVFVGAAARRECWSSCSPRWPSAPSASPRTRHQRRARAVQGEARHPRGDRTARLRPHRATSSPRARSARWCCPACSWSLMPVVVGVTFRIFKPGDPTIAAEAVAALLMVGTIVGILMALFLNNGGGAWDNAKKYIETGAVRRQRLDPRTRPRLSATPLATPSRTRPAPRCTSSSSCSRPSPSCSRRCSSNRNSKPKGGGFLILRLFYSATKILLIPNRF